MRRTRTKGRQKLTGNIRVWTKTIDGSLVTSPNMQGTNKDQSVTADKPFGVMGQEAFGIRVSYQ